MKVVVAIDSFKGSMTSMQAGNACKKGILAATKADVVVKPLADGGEGKQPKARHSLRAVIFSV